jgi:hypothetical protein
MLELPLGKLWVAGEKTQERFREPRHHEHRPAPILRP